MFLALSLISSYFSNLLLGGGIAAICVALWILAATMLGKGFSGDNPLRTGCGCLMILFLFLCTTYHTFFALTYSDLKDTATSFEGMVTAAVKDMTDKADDIKDVNVNEVVDAALDEFPLFSPYIQEFTNDIKSRAATVEELPATIVGTICRHLDNEMWGHIAWGTGLFVTFGLLYVVIIPVKTSRQYGGCRNRYANRRPSANRPSRPYNRETRRRR